MPGKSFLGIRRKSSFENFNDSLNKHLDEHRDKITLLTSTLSRLPGVLAGNSDSTAPAGTYASASSVATPAPTQATASEKSPQAVTVTGVTGPEATDSPAVSTVTTTTTVPSPPVSQTEPSNRGGKVAIIGAGPAGLCLANILARNGVPYTVFDLSDKSRNQGGTLDLHPQAGQAALKEAGLWQPFTQHARPESDVLKVVSPDGQVLWDGNTTDKQEVGEAEKFDGRPEIDRAALMDILLARLPRDSVRWSKKLQEVQPVYTNPVSYDLHFADGSVEHGFAAVVGADGAWSKVRPLLSDTRPSYSGVSGVELWLKDADRVSPWASAYVGAGNCYSFGAGRAMQAQRLGDGSVRTYCFRHLPEDFVGHGAREQLGIEWDKQAPAEVAARYIDAFYADCGSDLQRLMRGSAVDAVVPRSLYHLPVDFRWQHEPGTEAVTLIGDAAHLMTPFAGVGVNAALADSLTLGRAIVAFAKGTSGKKSWADVVAGYETDMFPRAEGFARKTAKGLKGHFSEGGSEELAGRLRAHHYGETKKQ